MTMELIDAPTTETIEIVEDRLDEIPDMICHLYHFADVALCGLNSKHDPHSCWHVQQGDIGISVSVGAVVCPGCGAPICPTCLDRHPDKPERRNGN